MPDEEIRKCRLKLFKTARKLDLSKSEILILQSLLFDYYNVETGECFPKDKTLAKKSNCSVRTVRRARMSLERKRLIKYFPDPTDKRRRKYRFPRLETMIAIDEKANKTGENLRPKSRTKRPRVDAKMSASHNKDITKLNEPIQRGRETRECILQNTKLHRSFDQFLKSASLPPLASILPTELFGEQQVFWVKYSSVPKAGTVDYELTVHWFREQILEQSNINQTG